MLIKQALWLGQTLEVDAWEIAFRKVQHQNIRTMVATLFVYTMTNFGCVKVHSSFIIKYVIYTNLRVTIPN